MVSYVWILVIYRTDFQQLPQTASYNPALHKALGAAKVRNKIENTANALRKVPFTVLSWLSVCRSIINDYCNIREIGFLHAEAIHGVCNIWRMIICHAIYPDFKIGCMIHAMVGKLIF